MRLNSFGHFPTFPPKKTKQKHTRNHKAKMQTKERNETRKRISNQHWPPHPVPKLMAVLSLSFCLLLTTRRTQCLYNFNPSGPPTFPPSVSFWSLDHAWLSLVNSSRLTIINQCLSVRSHFGFFFFLSFLFFLNFNFILFFSLTFRCKTLETVPMNHPTNQSTRQPPKKKKKTTPEVQVLLFGKIVFHQFNEKERKKTNTRKPNKKETDKNSEGTRKNRKKPPNIQHLSSSFFLLLFPEKRKFRKQTEKRSAFSRAPPPPEKGRGKNK